MRLLSHTDMATGQGNMGYQKIGQESRRKYCIKVVSWSLGLLNDYLKGATYGPGGTNEFAVCTPVALHRFNNGNDIVNYRQSI